jgi:NADH dehydrogenase/NADH:ubiquinone oxidoreductase subunit G
LAKAVINGRVVEFEPGISILDACRATGVDIPTLCHDERLKPIGSCRMCLVEIERKPHPLTACNNQLTDGMMISTHTPALENERRMILKMLAQDHPRGGLQKTPEKRIIRRRLHRIV